MNAKPQRKADEPPTALGAALQAKGFVGRNVALQIAIAAFGAVVPGARRAIVAVPEGADFELPAETFPAVVNGHGEA